MRWALEMAQGDILVSLGMPVYNEESHVAVSLESVLGQDYQNFELIVSDNDSTDKTLQIVQDYASRDKRIKVYTTDRNQGAVANFNRVLSLSTGTYFMFTSGHDVWQRDFLSKAVQVLEHNHDVVLGAAQVAIVDNEGKTIYRMAGSLDTRKMPAKVRFLQSTQWNDVYYGLAYGLIRSDALKGLSVRRNVKAPDVVLISELSLKGAFLQIRGTTHYVRRSHPVKPGVELTHESLERLETPSRLILPNASTYFALMSSAWHSQLSLRTRLSLLAEIWLRNIRSLPEQAAADAIFFVSVAVSLDVAKKMEAIVKASARRFLNEKIFIKSHEAEGRVASLAE